MRVLYLAPVGRTASQLSRRGLLDEEIRALAAAGVDAYVLSTHAQADTDAGHIHVRRLPPDSASERRRTLGFLARHVGQVPLPALTDRVRCYRAIRIERRASEVIEAERIDLIHSYFGWPVGFGGLLAKAATGRPLIAALRGSDVNVLPAVGYGSRLEASFDAALRRLLRTADATVAVSEFIRRQAHALGAPRDRSHVILKGVRVEQFGCGIEPDAARRALGLGCEPVILAVSGLVAIKGLKDVLRALAIVRRSCAFCFVVCGDGPEREALAREARRLGIGDRTLFAGAVGRKDIANYFAAANLFVHGALLEASGNVLLEAMASRLPVVCTDAGGPGEYVSNGITGFVVPVGDAAAMADRITRLLCNQSLRQSFGRVAREHAVTRFSYERMIDDTLALYGRLVAPGQVVANTIRERSGDPAGVAAVGEPAFGEQERCV